MPKLSDANHALIERTLSLKTDPNARRMYSANTINQLLDAAREEGVARPLALGGQHRGGEGESDLCRIEKAITAQPGVKKCIAHGDISVRQIANAVLRVMGATPARAEAQDEGAAGERGKSRGQVAYEGWAQGLPGCEWANQTRTQQRAWEKAAQAVIDAHPSPTPAADASGVIRVLERICETQKRLYGNGTGLHLAMLDLCIDARAELSLYQAALKSTAANAANT